jgi:hypothetical protein
LIGPLEITLALDTLGNKRRTFSVLAGVPFEIPFREVARQTGFVDRSGMRVAP